MGNTKDENVSYNAAQEMIWPTDNAATAARSEGAERQDSKTLGIIPSNQHWSLSPRRQAIKHGRAKN